MPPTPLSSTTERSRECAGSLGRRNSAGADLKDRRSKHDKPVQEYGTCTLHAPYARIAARAPLHDRRGVGISVSLVDQSSSNTETDEGNKHEGLGCIRVILEKLSPSLE